MLYAPIHRTAMLAALAALPLMAAAACGADDTEPPREPDEPSVPESTVAVPTEDPWADFQCPTADLVTSTLGVNVIVSEEVETAAQSDGEPLCAYIQDPEDGGYFMFGPMETLQAAYNLPIDEEQFWIDDGWDVASHPDLADSGGFVARKDTNCYVIDGSTFASAQFFGELDPCQLGVALTSSIPR